VKVGWRDVAVGEIDDRDVVLVGVVGEPGVGGEPGVAVHVSLDDPAVRQEQVD
jgi:hypothetical protein